MKGRRHRDRQSVVDILVFLERISKTIANKSKPLDGMLESWGIDNPYGKADNAILSLEWQIGKAIADLQAVNDELLELNQ